MLYSLTISFAAVDWVMSLDPHWGSTIYGLIFMAGQGLSALAFCVIMLTVLTRYSPYREIIKPMQFHDIGKLMLAFVMLFAYFSFSQWLIIWAGNLPEEIGWYPAPHTRRMGRGGADHHPVPLCAAVRAAAVARAQTRRQPPDRAGRVADVHAAGGHLLVRGAELRPRTGTLLPQHLVHRGADRGGRTVAGATSSTTCGSGRCCRLYEPQIPSLLHQRSGMATENAKYDPLRNPEVDYDRTDLSARGILLFLVGLLVAGVFIELVIWGMFRFMAKSDVLFPQAQPNPMMSAQKACARRRLRGRCCRTHPAVDIIGLSGAAAANGRCRLT